MFTVYSLRFTVYSLQFTVYGLQFTISFSLLHSSFYILHNRLLSPLCFCHVFCREGKKSPANFVWDTRQKHNFVFILIPGLKPRAMDIFLLWRNGNFVVFKRFVGLRFTFSLFTFHFFIPRSTFYILRFFFY